MASVSSSVLLRLAQRLQLTRPLAFVDLETTGVMVDSDRIVEIAVAIVRPGPGGPEAIEYNWLINPGMPIPPASTAVHHITDADVQSAPRFEEVADRVARDLSGCDIAGYNVGFDLRVLTAEFRRLGKPIDFSGAKVLDAFLIFRQKETRDLSNAVRFYCGREHAGAHRAIADVTASAEVLLAQLERYEDLGSMSVEALARFCRPPRVPGALTEDGKIIWRDGAARLTFGKHKDQPLQDVVQSNPGYLKWLADNSEFAMDVRSIVALALRGKYPAPPEAA